MKSENNARIATLLAFCMATAFFANVQSVHAEESSAESPAESSAEAAPYRPLATADLTWASEYIMDGFRIGGDHPVFQPSLSVNAPLDGVSAMLWSSLQVDRDNQQYDELDLMARYSKDFMQGTRSAFNLHGYYDYWDYPKLSATGSTHGSKVNAGVSATHLLSIAGSYLVPSYNLYYWIYWAQGNLNLWQGGAHHEFLLQYFHEVPKFIPNARYQYAGISASLNYNDGAFAVQPGWSHSVLELSTGVYALDGLISASVNRQWSYQPSVDPYDELWTTFSFTKEF